MWTITQYSAAAYVIIASAGLFGFGSSFGQNCQCVYLTGTKGQFWGRFSISSKDIRYNSTECVLIFVTGADQEIVELRFEEITLRKGCADVSQNALP